MGGWLGVVRVKDLFWDDDTALGEVERCVGAGRN